MLTIPKQKKNKLQIGLRAPVSKWILGANSFLSNYCFPNPISTLTFVENLIDGVAKLARHWIANPTMWVQVPPPSPTFNGV